MQKQEKKHHAQTVQEMKMNFEFRELEMSKKEKREVEEYNKYLGSLIRSFISGFFFFLTVPVFIYKKIENYI